MSKTKLESIPVEVRVRNPSAERGTAKTARNPVKINPDDGPVLAKPPWIRVRAPSGPAVPNLKAL
ncbi:MAG: hypothetical protein ACI8PT_003755, partial [Gammaproteobacteria bacterium]|jgi:hypothetical protein